MRSGKCCLINSVYSTDPLFRQNTVPFSGVAGMKFRRSSLPAYVCLVHVFKLFFNRQVVHLFVEQTKLNYEWKKEGCTTCQTQDHVVPHDHPRDKCSYLSPLPWVLIVQLPKMCDYWRQKQWLFHLPVFAEVMPRGRFLQIYHYLHVSDDSQAIPRGNNNHNPLFEVHDMNTLLQTCFSNLYNPAQELSIDESMIPF